VDGVDGVDGVDKLAGWGDEAAGLGEGGLLEEPGGMGTLFPLGEVSLADGTGGKFDGHYLLDLCGSVQPRQD
jgi:hypothetical protein